MEKTISIRNTEITFSIWDLGGKQRLPEPFFLSSWKSSVGGWVDGRGCFLFVRSFSLPLVPVPVEKREGREEENER